MAIEFEQPVVAGTTLIREAITSPNYVAGVSGWTIRADGSAEFNSVDVRGDGEFGTPGGQRVEISSLGVISIYDSTNSLVGEWSEDGFEVTNPSSGSTVYMVPGTSTATMGLIPAAQVGYTYGSGFIYATSDSFNGDAWVTIQSPVINSGNTSTIYLYGKNATAKSEIHLDAERVRVGNNLRGIGSGPVALDWSASNSAAVTAETIVLTATSAAYENGRAYRCDFGNLADSSLANGRISFRVRKTNLAGTQLGFSGVMTCQTALTSQQSFGSFYIKNETGADIIATLVLTLQHVDGGANTARQRATNGLSRYLQIFDCGEAGSFPFAADLT